MAVGEDSWDLSAIFCSGSSSISSRQPEFSGLHPLDVFGHAVKTDGSDYSKAAVNSVAERPWPEGSEVKIASAMEIPYAPTTEAWVMPSGYYSEIEAGAAMDADESAPDPRAAERFCMAGGCRRWLDALQWRRSLREWERSCALLAVGNQTKDGAYSYIPFGGQIHEERAFGGYTIPSKVSVGWRLGTEDYFEFFRAQIEDIVFR